MPLTLSNLKQIIKAVGIIKNTLQGAAKTFKLLPFVIDM